MSALARKRRLTSLTLVDLRAAQQSFNRLIYRVLSKLIGTCVSHLCRTPVDIRPRMRMLPSRLAERTVFSDTRKPNKEEEANTVSYFLIGVSFWAVVALGSVGSAVVAALARTATRHLGRALGNQVERLREQVEHASAAFHEPLTSSPSHPSFPPPR